MYGMVWLLGVAAASGVFTSCGPSEPAEDAGAVLAEVGDQKLYLSDAASLVAAGTSAADSVELIRLYVERWTRTAAMLDRAEQRLGSEPEIERLVRDYRASLLLERYHQQLLEAREPVEISEVALEEAYAQAGSAMRADMPLLRATLIKVPAPVPDKAEFELAWYSPSDADAQAYLSTYVKQHAQLSLLDKDKWVELAQLESLLPGDKLNLPREGTRVVRDDGYVYYVRILATVSAGEPMPLAYVRDRLVKALMEQQQAAFLSEIKEQTYAEARRRNEIKINFGNAE